MTTRFPLSSSSLLIGVALALTACASIPPPTEQMAVSRAAVDQARRAGAPTEAADDFNEAQRKLELATLALKDKKHLEAKRLAEQAEVDAALAQAKTGAARAESAANQIQTDIKVLRDELDRKSNPGG